MRTDLSPLTLNGDIYEPYIEGADSLLALQIADSLISFSANVPLLPPVLYGSKYHANRSAHFAVNGDGAPLIVHVASDWDVTCSKRSAPKWMGQDIE